MEPIKAAQERQELRTLREAKGLSQEKLAELAGISRSYYTQIEGGQRNPSMENIRAICRALGINESLKLF